MKRPAATTHIWLKVAGTTKDHPHRRRAAEPSPCGRGIQTHEAPTTPGYRRHPEPIPWWFLLGRSNDQDPDSSMRISEAFALTVAGFIPQPPNAMLRQAPEW